MTHSIASQQAREKRGMCALSWGRISAAWQTVPSPLLSESMRIKSSNSRAVILSTGLAYHHHEQHAAFSRLVAPWPGRSMYVCRYSNREHFIVCCAEKARNNSQFSFIVEFKRVWRVREEAQRSGPQ